MRSFAVVVASEPLDLRLELAEGPRPGLGGSSRFIRSTDPDTSCRAESCRRRTRGGDVPAHGLSWREARAGTSTARRGTPVQTQTSRRLGITVGHLVGSLVDGVRLSRDAEGHGYTDVWSEESGGTDGLSSLAAVATRTSRMRLGTAILPVFTRPPALLAMAAASVQDLSGGRFVLGLGTSSSIIVERWMGQSFERPLQRLREYVEVLREILSGRKVRYEGESVQVLDFRLQHQATQPIPIYLAALGPNACRLAGRVADGVILFMKTSLGVRQALEWVREGAAAAGRDPAELDCVLRIPVALDEDPVALRPRARRAIVGYGMVDVYNRSLARQGFEDETRAITEAWTAGDRTGATEAVSDEMIEQLFAAGDRERCVDRIRTFRDAGVRTPVLYPFTVAEDTEERTARVRAAVEALGES